MNDKPLSEQYRLVAKEWVEAHSAASLMEETKSHTVAYRMSLLGNDVPVGRREMEVKASLEYREYVREMVELRKQADLLKVKLEWVRMRFQEWNSAEASKRAEMKL